MKHHLTKTHEDNNLKSTITNYHFKYYGPWILSQPSLRHSGTLFMFYRGYFILSQPSLRHSGTLFRFYHGYFILSQPSLRHSGTLFRFDHGNFILSQPSLRHSGTFVWVLPWLFHIEPTFFETFWYFCLGFTMAISY